MPHPKKTGREPPRPSTDSQKVHASLRDFAAGSGAATAGVREPLLPRGGGGGEAQLPPKSPPRPPALEPPVVHVSPPTADDDIGWNIGSRRASAKRTVEERRRSLAEEMVLSPVMERPNGQNTWSQGESQSDDLDIVQFSSPMYFVEEHEGFLQIDIMRLGSMNGTCTVHWQTEDATAVAGVRYHAGAGDVTFEHGEDTKSIRVNIIHDDRWWTTVEFKLTLHNPQNCELGKYLHMCRVKVIDVDVFPSSKYKTKILEGVEGIETIPVIGLFVEFFKLIFKNRRIGRRTVIMLLLNQLENLYVLFQLYVNIYLVDVLFNINEPETEHKLLLNNRRDTASLVGILYIVPMFILHFVDYKQIRLDVAGHSREFMQENLFRKYLNFSEKTRGIVSPASMQVAILTDTGEVVEGYMSVIELIKSVLKLTIMISFILKENSNALVPVILMPTSMAFFVVARTKTLVDACEVVAHRTAKVVEVVQESCQKYTMIAEYLQRPAMCTVFNHASSMLTEAATSAEEVKVNNNYFPKWLGPTFIGIYIALYAGPVLDGTAGLGPFLATIRVFKELSEEFLEMYLQLMTIASASGPLRKLTWIFNLPTDALLWKKVNRERRERTRIARLAVLKNTPAVDDNGEKILFRSDLIRIGVSNVSYSFGSNVVLKNVDISTEQGKMVAIVGEHGSGKRTFLRLLGHFLFPDSGHILIPTYLRIIHVSQDPTLMNFSAYKNLTFGAPHENPARVLDILKLLGMSRTLDLVQTELKEEAKQDAQENGSQNDEDADLEAACGEEEGEDGVEKWQDTLNYVEIAKIHLARALIVNPEVLVLQRPLIHYDDREGDRIAQVLHSHVVERGLCMPQEGSSRRRPRTCFFSPSTAEEVRDADIIWRIKNARVTEIAVADFSTEDIPK
eukprot:TRINITY_DN22345_c0_g1_i1.p1 TRINITY_DN22345_c0_g1~~TRINITY_DN22345_c0_g1_i1.p1  ORF type:complete len:923 (+),score=178.65 TRINITY_DN22345_c0_g1_i1:62-2770(+)